MTRTSEFFYILYEYIENIRRGKYTTPVCLPRSFVPLCLLLNGAYFSFEMPSFIEFAPSTQLGQGVMVMDGKGMRSTAAKLYVSSDEVISMDNDSYSRRNPLWLVVMMLDAMKSMPERVVVGTFAGESVRDKPVKEWGTCIEVLSKFEDIMKQEVTNFRLSMPMPSYPIVWDTLLSNRGYIKHIERDSAVKRAALEMAKMDWNLIDYDKDTYKMYKQKLATSYRKQHESKSTFWPDVWREYMWYDISRSKLPV